LCLGAYASEGQWQYSKQCNGKTFKLDHEKLQLKLKLKLKLKNRKQRKER
jgi:hypothetical protein